MKILAIVNAGYLCVTYVRYQKRGYVYPLPYFINLYTHVVDRSSGLETTLETT